jgi:hypothetical protein
MIGYELGSSLAGGLNMAKSSTMLKGKMICLLTWQHFFVFALLGEFSGD